MPICTRCGPVEHQLTTAPVKLMNRKIQLCRECTTSLMKDFLNWVEIPRHREYIVSSYATAHNDKHTTKR